MNHTTPYEKPLSPFWVINPKKPTNALIFLSFLSPAIIATATLGLSFVLQTWQGIVFICFLLGSCVVRSVLCSQTDIYEKLVDTKPMCNAIKYTTIGNNTFSVFVSCFTLSYMAVPMFINNNINWILFTALLIYIVFDIGIKIVYKCIEKTNGVQLGMDILMGTFLAVAWTSAMMSDSNSSKHLFFSNSPSDQQQCNVPKKQQFKCNVYKNGEVIANI